jgi:hypothetical protein
MGGRKRFKIYLHEVFKMDENCWAKGLLEYDVETVDMVWNPSDWRK